MISSASDDRTANNAVRHQYRVLSDAEKASMVAIKDAGAALIEAIRAAGSLDGTRTTPIPHYYQLALDSAELSVMWAVKEITK